MTGRYTNGPIPYDSIYFTLGIEDRNGNIVATSNEVWKEVIIPQVLDEFVESERNKLSNRERDDQLNYLFKSVYELSQELRIFISNLYICGIWKVY